MEERKRIYREPASPEAQQISETASWQEAITKMAASHQTVAETILLAFAGKDSISAQRLKDAQAEAQSRIQHYLNERARKGESNTDIPAPSSGRLKKEERLRGPFLKIVHQLQLYRWEEGVRAFNKLYRGTPDEGEKNILADWMQSWVRLTIRTNVMHHDGGKVLSALEQLASCDWFDKSLLRSEFEKIHDDERIWSGIQDELVFAVPTPERFTKLSKALNHFGLSYIREERNYYIEAAAQKFLAEPLDQIHWKNGVREYSKRKKALAQTDIFKEFPTYQETLLQYPAGAIKGGNISEFLRRMGRVIQNEPQFYPDHKNIVTSPIVVKAARDYLVQHYAYPNLSHDDWMFGRYGRDASALADVGIMSRSEFDALPEIQRYLHPDR